MYVETTPTLPRVIGRVKEVPYTETATSITVESAFSVEAMVRGYHIYSDIWTAVVNEELHCRREPFSAANPFAVAVVKEDTGCPLLGGSVIGGSTVA